MPIINTTGKSAFDSSGRRAAQQAAAQKRQQMMESPNNAITRGKQAAQRSLQLRNEKFAQSQQARFQG